MCDMGPFPLKRLLRSTYTLTFSHSRTFFLHHALASPIVPSSEGAPGANQGGQPSAPPVVDGADISTGATDASAEAREARRKRIEERTATVDDIRAEIAAQERELSAAVEERKQIDSKLEAAETRQAKYEKELEECKTALAAKHPGVDIADLRSEKERLEASIKDVLATKKRLGRPYEQLNARIEELGADIAALKQQMGAWHD